MDYFPKLVLATLVILLVQIGVEESLAPPLVQREQGRLGNSRRDGAASGLLRRGWIWAADDQGDSGKVRGGARGFSDTS
ncbi:hypothetical protein AKJ16_DCAP07810 [Drosera capensis]